MEGSVSKTQLEGEQKSSGITCHLCEVREIDRKSKLNDFVEGTIIIEAHCKLQVLIENMAVLGEIGNHYQD